MAHVRHTDLAVTCSAYSVIGWHDGGREPAQKTAIEASRQRTSTKRRKW